MKRPISLIAFAMVCGANARQASSQTPWTIDPKPVTIVAEHQLHNTSHLHNISFALPIANDRFVIADAHSGRLLLIDASGHVLKAVGRSGNGPGEFRHIASISGCGTDSVYVWDKVRRKVSVIDPHGEYVREFSLRADDKPDATDEVVCSRDGVFAYLASPDPASMKRNSNGVIRGASKVRVTDNTGKLLLTLDESVPSTEYLVFKGGAGPRPLGKRTQLALIRNQLAIVTGDSTQIAFISLRDQSRTSMPIKGLSATIAQDDYLAAVEDVLAMVPPPFADSVRAAMIGLGPPQAAPAIRTIIRGDDGFFWIAGNGLNGATRIQALDATGKTVTTAEIGGRFTPTAVSAEFILGIVDMPDGDRALQSYRIRR